MVERAVDLHEQGDSEEALRVYDAVLVRFGNATELECQVNVALALSNKAGQLYQMGRFEDSLVAYRGLQARLRQASDGRLREQGVRSLLHAARTLREVGRYDEAIAVCDELVNEYGRDRAQAVEVRVARARQMKAIILRDAGRIREAVTVLEREVIPQLGGTTDEDSVEDAALAFYNRAVMLDELDDKAAATRAYDDFLRRFDRQTSSSAVAACIANARDRRCKLDPS